MSTSSITHNMPIIGQFDEDCESVGSVQPATNVDYQFASTTSVDDLARKPCFGSVQLDNFHENLNTRMSRSLEAPGYRLPSLGQFHRSRTIEAPHVIERPVDLPDDDDTRRAVIVDATPTFPWVEPSCNVAISQSLPVSQLHNAQRFRFDQAAYDHIDNESIPPTRKNIKVVGPAVYRAESKPRFVGKTSAYVRNSAGLVSGSPQNMLSSSVGDAQRRQLLNTKSSYHTSELAAGSPKPRHQHGSSIFGSKMFESMTSLTSDSSQHLHVITEPSGIDPTLGPCSVDDSVHDYLNDSIRNVDLLSEQNLNNGDGEIFSRASVVNADTVDLNDEPFDDEEIDSVTVFTQATDILVSAAAKRKWSHQVMPDLVEGPESDTAQGSDRRHLATVALSITKGDQDKQLGAKEATTTYTDSRIPETIFDERAERRRYMKNLIVISISFFCIFMAYMAVRNLQSSLNTAGGLGLYALSSVYGFLFIGSLFTTTIVQRLGPKRALTLSMLSFVLYNLANFYPRFYTLVPMSAVVGFFLAVLWTAHATYLTNIAIGYAKLTNSQATDVLGRFNGIFFAFFQAAQIAGGLITSLLLTSSSSSPAAIVSAGTNLTNLTYHSTLAHHVWYGNLSMNLTDHSEPMFEDDWYGNLSAEVNSSMNDFKRNTCGSSYCPSQRSSTKQARKAPDPHVVYILLGIFLVSTVAGVGILVFFLDPLEGIMVKKRANFTNQMTAIFRLFRDRHVVCLGFSFYSLLQSTFMFGEFTKAFVTCSVGVHLIGYFMLSISLSSGISAYVTGSLQKYIGRIVLNLTAMLIHLVLLIVMFFWESDENQTHLFFVIAFLWGTSDGIIGSQIVSLIGSQFASNKEPAFAAHKMFQSMSAFAMFITAPYTCTRMKIIFVGCVLLIAVCGYVALEVMLKIEKKIEKAKLSCAKP